MKRHRNQGNSTATLDSVRVLHGFRAMLDLGRFKEPTPHRQGRWLGSLHAQTIRDKIERGENDLEFKHVLMLSNSEGREAVKTAMLTRREAWERNQRVGKLGFSWSLVDASYKLPRKKELTPATARA